jgi:hypothetical protein
MTCGALIVPVERDVIQGFCAACVESILSVGEDGTAAGSGIGLGYFDTGMDTSNT